MDIARKLEKLGFAVQKFNEWHYRVNDDFDFWVNARNKALAWHDRFTGDRGWKPEDQIVSFIKVRLRRDPSEVTEEEFMQRLMQIGWTFEEAKHEWNARKLGNPA